MTTSSVIRYEPRDFEGRVNVFWNQAMFVFVFVVEVAGVQPMGQVMIGSGGVDVFEEKRNRKGVARRYWGRPGNSASTKRRTNRVVRCWLDVSELDGIFWWWMEFET